MWLLRLPGVYRPKADTQLLTKALRDATFPPEARVLDVGTGTGALALAARRTGAAEVVAMDVSRRAVLTARVNATARRLPVYVERGDAFSRQDRSFDVILANPPYVPCANPALPAKGAARAWSAGVDGRAFLDPLCTRGPDLLTSGGMLLVVHSGLCGESETLRQLRERGLKTSVVARRRVEFGPLLHARTSMLEHEGFIEPGQREEELVVIRGDKPEQSQ